jgi:hypothetical protein
VSPYVTGAGDDAGRLLVAYWYREKQAARIGLARGDARGNRLRLSGSIELPEHLGGGFTGPTLSSQVGMGVFGRGGYATIAVYGGLKMRVAILGS